MYFEFYNENGNLNLCRLTGYKAFITFLFGRKIAKRVPKKDIKFIQIKVKYLHPRLCGLGCFLFNSVVIMHKKKWQFLCNFLSGRALRAAPNYHYTTPQEICQQ